MFIDGLPDDCLITIFNFIFDLNELNNCSQVNLKWSQLISVRSRNVNYLRAHHVYDRLYSKDTVYFGDYDTLLATNIPELFPNLKILALVEPVDSWVDQCHRGQCFDPGFTPLYLQFVNKKVMDFVKAIESVKGVIYSLPFSTFDQGLSFCKNLDMIAMYGHIDRYFTIGGHGVEITQLSICNIPLDQFLQSIRFFPNLKRLQYFNEENTDFNTYFKRPILRDLEILEISLPCSISHYDCIFSMHGGLPLMDFCPSLKSAWLLIGFELVHVNESIKNDNLQDLVLQFYRSFRDWSILKKYLTKYPNLKHLAIRGCRYLTEENVKELVQLLPRLVLLDLRGSERCIRKSITFLRNHLKQIGRSLKIYINNDIDKVVEEVDHDHKIRSDYESLQTDYQPICRGWDFMKHCFFKDTIDRPSLWDPVDS